MIKVIKSIFEIQILKTAAALTGGRFFNLAVSIVLLLIQARFIGPEITGVCQSYAIPVGYLWILTMGVPSALARELPYYLGRGERDKALQLAQTTQSFSIAVGGICAGAFLVMSIRALVLGDYLSAAGWGFQIIAGFFVIYSSYVQTLYRTTSEFIKIAKASTISAIASIIAFPLVFWNPYLGIWIRGSAAQLSANIYYFINRPFKLGFGFDLETFKSLAKFGLPLIAIGYIESSLWSSAQMTLIFKMSGARELGLFVFINSILSALLIIPNAVIDILRPRFAAVYGESDGDLRRTLAIAVKPMMLTFLVTVLEVLVCWLIIDDIIGWLLPKYVEAIPALDVALLLLPVMAVKSIKYVFVVSKNMRHNFFSTAPGFTVGSVLLYILLSQGFAFQYIFIPYLTGQLLNLAITLLIIMKSTGKKAIGNESD